MRSLALTLLAAALVGCGSGEASRNVPAMEKKSRPNQSYDGPNGGK